jgi:hypothetical protein
VYLTVFSANCFSALKVVLPAKEPKKHQQTAIATVGVAGYAVSFSVGSSDFIDVILSEDLPTQHHKNSVTSLIVEVP